MLSDTFFICWITLPTNHQIFDLQKRKKGEGGWETDKQEIPIKGTLLHHQKENFNLSNSLQI